MKNKKNKIYFAFGIVIVLLLAVFLGFRIVKTNTFKSKITHVSEKLIKTQDSLINNQKIFNKPVSINAEITSDSVLDEKINVTAKLDLANNVSEFGINPSVLNLNNPIEFYIHNSRKFVKNNDILSRMYEVSIDTSSVSCDATLECNTFTKQLKNVNLDYPKDKIVNLVNHSKDLINNSIGLFDIKSTNLKNDNYNKKYTYTIDSNTLKKLKKNFNKDKELKSDFYNLFVDYFNRYNINEDNINTIFDSNITGSIAIYKDKNNNNNKYEVTLDNLFTIILEENKDIDKVSINLLNNFQINIELDYLNNKLSLSSLNGTQEVVNLTLDSKDILNLSGKININNKDYVLVSEDNINYSNDNTRSGTLKVNLNNKNYTVTYNWEYVEDLEKSMVDNYANYTELTKEDMNNIETNLLKLTQSELLKDILAF